MDKEQEGRRVGLLVQEGEAGVLRLEVIHSEGEEEGATARQALKVEEDLHSEAEIEVGGVRVEAQEVFGVLLEVEVALLSRPFLRQTPQHVSMPDWLVLISL